MPSFRKNVLPLAFIVPLLVPGKAATAQFSSALDVGAGSSRLGDSRWRGALSVAPDVRFDSRWLTLAGRGTVSRISALGDAAGDRGRSMEWDALLRADLASPAWGGLRASASLAGERSWLHGREDRYQTGEYSSLALLADSSTSSGTLLMGAAELRLSYRAGGWGVWLGRDAVIDNRATPLPVNADGSLGVWRQLGGAILSVSLSNTSARTGARAPSGGGRGPRDSSFNDTTRTWDYYRRTLPSDSGSAGTLRAFSDAQASVHWMRGRYALDASFGTRVRARAVPTERWGRVDAVIAIAPRAAIVLGAGIRPSALAYATPSTRYANVGVRLSASSFFRSRVPVAVRPVAAAFERSSAGPGRHTLRVRVPNARVVELSGSFVAWKPVTMRRAESDLWEVTLPISAGTHQIAIRVDGDAWLAPPGTTKVADDFNGTVGLVVVP